VRSGNKEAKFWLRDLSIALNVGYAPHEINDIVWHLQSHREEVLEAWNEHFGD
jgi:hypothetical protein